jgi:hypothetical protein
MLKQNSLSACFHIMASKSAQFKIANTELEPSDGFVMLMLCKIGKGIALGAAAVALSEDVPCSIVVSRHLLKHRPRLRRN